MISTWISGLKIVRLLTVRNSLQAVLIEMSERIIASSIFSIVMQRRTYMEKMNGMQ